MLWFFLFIDMEMGEVLFFFERDKGAEELGDLSPLVGIRFNQRLAS